MSRDWQLYVEDIELACEKILRYIDGLSAQTFRADEKTYDAVVRNLEIIGEAAKNLPDAVRHKHPEIEWRKISGLRDVIAHGYFGLDDAVVWDILQSKVPALLRAVKKISDK